MHQYLQRRSLARFGLISTILMLGACKLGGGSSGGSDAPPAPEANYKATIERTTYGIPHITADNFGGAGYGHGYAISEDNLCVLADAFLTFQGERSRHFGPDALASPMSTFGSPPNLEADFFFRFVVDDQQVNKFKSAQSDEVLELLRGFTAGYNRYVTEIQDGQHPDRHADCRDQEWLVPITEDDLMRRLVGLNLAASSANWVEEIASAKPPAIGAATMRSRTRSAPQELNINPERFKLGRKDGIGSNTFAFGSSATESGDSLLFANPHWYHLGIDRFYQVHMTVPGKLDISGAAIMGSPMIQMGFNDNIAWAHTVSTAYRFTLYQLQLASGDPTHYIQDGEEKALEPTEITIQVKRADGSLAPESRTLYRSVYGPMINLSSMGLPGWNEQTAFTLRDINLDNTRSFENFFAWNQAESLSDFYDISRQYVGIPWVNTTAIGRGDDRALYSDITAVPNVPDSMLPTCLTGLGSIVIQVVPGLPLLDGSRTECDWRTDPDSKQDGAFGPDKLPSLFSTDYVANMNDSYWLSNPEQPLTGFDGIIGREDYQQTLRTRMGHILARERLTGTDGLNGHQASNENIRNIVLNNRVYSAELLKDEVLASVCADGATPSEQTACQILASWNNTGEIDAVGAHIWSAFWAKVQSLDLYAIPFDAADPINTPAGLSSDSNVQENVRSAFSSAVAELEDANIPLNAKLGEIQFFLKPGENIPQYGGEGSEGYFTVLRNTYMHVVDFPEGESVRAYTLLSNSQSTDPSSPHYADYTEAYSAKNWHQVPFTRAQIEAESISSIDISE